MCMRVLRVVFLALAAVAFSPTVSADYLDEFKSTFEFRKWACEDVSTSVRRMISDFDDSLTEEQVFQKNMKHWGEVLYEMNRSSGGDTQKKVNTILNNGREYMRWLVAGTARERWKTPHDFYRQCMADKSQISYLSHVWGRGAFPWYLYKNMEILEQRLERRLAQQSQKQARGGGW